MEAKAYRWFLDSHGVLMEYHSIYCLTEMCDSYNLCVGGSIPSAYRKMGSNSAGRVTDQNAGSNPAPTVNRIAKW